MITDSEEGISTRMIKKKDDKPLDSNIVFDRKFTLSLRDVLPCVFLLFNIPIMYVAEAPTPNTKPDKIDDSIFV